MAAEDDLRHELESLHRGRGARRPGVAKRLGPTLATVLAIDPRSADGDAQIRLFAALREVSRVLPPDLRLVFLTASAVMCEERLMQDRLGLACERLDRNLRTVKRRLKEADALVASALAERLRVKMSSASVAPAGWYVESLHSTLLLDRPRPEFIGSRAIFATQTVDTITDTISIPRPESAAEGIELELEAMSGCAVRTLERQSASNWKFSLALPAALSPGERHSYAVLIRVPSLNWIRPYSVMVPLRPCYSFTTEVHLDDPDQVDHMWLLDGVPPAAVEDHSQGELVHRGFDSVLSASFTDLTPGLAYGLRWHAA